MLYFLLAILSASAAEVIPVKIIENIQLAAGRAIQLRPTLLHLQLDPEANREDFAFGAWRIAVDRAPDRLTIRLGRSFPETNATFLVSPQWEEVGLERRLASNAVMEIAGADAEYRLEIGHTQPKGIGLTALNQ